MNSRNTNNLTNTLLSIDADLLLRRVAIQAKIINRKSKGKSGCKVLYPTSYLHVDFNRIVDFILATALKVRDVEIVPILCDGFHTDQCSVFPGLFSKNFSNDCLKLCKLPGSILWEDILGYKTLSLKNFEDPKDRNVAEQVADKITIENYADIFYNGYDLGRQVGIEVRNANNLASMLDNAICQNELRTHTINAVRMLQAYERVFDEVNPNRVVGSWHDNYQWSTLFDVASRRGVHYYSHTMLDQPGCLYFGRDHYESCEVHDAWQSFKDLEVSDEVWKKFDKTLGIRADGMAAVSGVYPNRNPQNIASLTRQLEPNKPVVFFPVNTPWDDAVRNNCYVGDDILGMVQKVLRYFDGHRQYQLILKAHPNEQNFNNFGDLPHSVANIIKTKYENIPSNIIFLDADTPVSAFDVYGLADLGIVHSTRSGCEMAMYGVPTILAADTHYRGKGFTIDAENEDQFFGAIEEVLNNREPEKVKLERIEVARKYWLLYNSHGYINLGMFEGGWHQPLKINFSDIDNFLPGADEKLDYICACVISNKPVFGDNHWPPISL